ncbi:MAG TPA: LuxR C-terminal-related transcriptional regulator, partial [Burkholderiales bacterium]|nr:LuxR C-terminal-related transcriptional regulator [Burkholderiales bacterium]
DLLRFLDDPALAVGLFVPRLAAAPGGVYVQIDALRAALPAASAPAARSQAAADLGLSVRQAEVLELLLKGLPNKLIARRLGISENTAKIHVSAVLRALGVSTRTQALIAASRLGLRFDA